MTRFRPCIDLHDGKVKQIVGGTLDRDGGGAVENFVSDRPARYFAGVFARDRVPGGHVIMLGPGNEAPAREALAAYPGGLQVGGGVRADNAGRYLDAGASHVIVTSWLFPEMTLSEGRLDEIGNAVGVGRLVVDLSCRRTTGGWAVAKDRWQTVTGFEITPANLDRLVGRCDELLVHAADVEGRCGGVDRELVEVLGGWAKMPVTYAGGARSTGDLAEVDRLSRGNVDLTIGSALDLFGGTGARYSDCIAWNEGRLAGGLELGGQ